MDKVAIYARVSTSDGLQQFDRQISDLTKVINFHGYKDNQIEIFAEKLSGYDKERPQLNKLLKQAKDFKCIYVSEISRIGRNPTHTRKIIDDLTDENIPIYIQSIGQTTIDVDGKRNSTMSIILQVLMEFSHSESETMKSRMKSGKMQAVKEGKVAGNNQAYGYANVDKMQLIDEDEAIVVEKIFQLYLEGKGTRVIAGILNDMQIPTRLAKTHKDKTLTFEKTGIEKQGSDILWDGNTILTMIKNPIYKGTRIFKGEEIKAKPIISVELWEQCNQIRTTKTHRNYLTSYTYLLKDFCYCGKCGKKYLGNYNEENRLEVYKCVSKLKKGQQCGNTGLNINLIESIIYHQLINSDSLLKYIENPNDIMNEIKANLSDLELQLKLESTSLRNKETELERLLDLYLANSNYKKELFEKKEATLSSEIESINKRITLLKKQIFDKKLSITNYNKEIATKEMLINAKENRNELQTIFKQFINKIYINTINKRFVLVTLEIKINGIVTLNTLKLIIDVPKSKMRGYIKTKSFEYIALSKMVNNPVFKNNILMNDIKDIEEEIENIYRLAESVKGNTTMKILPDTIDVVPKENWLSINI